VIRGHANVRRALFEHLDDRSQDARDGPERQALRWETPQAVIVAKQLVSAVDEVNHHVVQKSSRRRRFESDFLVSIADQPIRGGDSNPNSSAARDLRGSIGA
jgi:hypothetical protein